CHQVCPTRIESSCLNENNVCFNATNPFETYTLSLHDALPISITYRLRIRPVGSPTWLATLGPFTRSIKSVSPLLRTHLEWRHVQDRKSTRLNSSHVKTSYAVFCLKKKNTVKVERNKEYTNKKQ